MPKSHEHSPSDYAVSIVHRTQVFRLEPMQVPQEVIIVDQAVVDANVQSELSRAREALSRIKP